MKRAAAFLISAILLILTAAAVLPMRANAAGKTVELDISVKQNVLMAKYNVEVYFDGVYLETIPHGGSTQIVLEEKGSFHDLHFYKEGDQLVSGSTVICTDRDQVFSCEVINHERYVEAVIQETPEPEYGTGTYGGFEYHINEEGNIIIDHYKGSAHILEVPKQIDGYPVKEIAPEAFRANLSLQWLELPSGLEIIGEEAFDMCILLESVNIPQSVRYIGDRAFGYCSSLEEIYLPFGLELISNGMFQGCMALTSVNIPGSVRYIGDSAFFLCLFSEISVPSSVQGIGVSAFDSCISLESVQIPSSVQSLGSYAFAKCYSLTSAGIPGSVKALNKAVFNKCNVLTDVRLSEGIERIGEEAFQNCDYLTEIVIPNSVTAIDKKAFNKCNSLSRVKIPSGVQEIAEDAFESCTPILLVEKGSYAASFALKNGLTLEYTN